MTYKESVKFLALIKLSYPNSYKDIDKDTQLATVNMWQRAFESVPFAIMEMALDHFVKVSKYPPAISDICEELKNLHSVALFNVLSEEDSSTIDINLFIVENTKNFKETDDYKIAINDMQKSLNCVQRHLIES